MSEVLIFLLGKLCEQLVEEGIKYIAREAVDVAGRKIVEFVQQIDTDGDGIYDDEIVLHSMNYIIPDLDDDYCFVSDGDTVGIGLPAYKIIDGITMGEYIDFNDIYNYPVITGNDDGFLVDMDHDGNNDDVLIALPDLTGDGYQEYGWILDTDHNGVPDASADYPYYPVGSEGYYEIMSVVQEDEAPQLMTKDFDDYSVTEGMLLILVVFALINFLKGLFRKREVF